MNHVFLLNPFIPQQGRLWCLFFEEVVEVASLRGLSFARSALDRLTPQNCLDGTQVSSLV